MIKRGMLVGAIPFLAGILFGIYHETIPQVVCATGILCIILLYSYTGVLRDKDAPLYYRGAIIALCLIMFGIGACRAFASYDLCNGSNSFFSVEKEVSLSGRVYKKEYKNDAIRYYLKDISIEGISGRYRGKVMVVSDDPIDIGSVILVKGTTASFRIAENDGSFCERDYYGSQGIYGKVNASAIEIISRPNIGISERLYRLKENMNGVYYGSLPGEEPGILSAMTLGDRGGLSEDIREMFQSAGIAHILAISGLHISIVGQALYKLLRKRFSYIVSGMISLFVVILYGQMTGGSVSTLRAVVMYAIMCVSDILGDTYDPMSAVCLSGMAFLLYEPMYIKNPGFIFSYGAVIGVCTVGRPISNAYEIYAKKRWESIHRKDHGQRFKKNIKERLTSQLIFSITIWIFTMPMIANNYYAVPVYVIGLNLLLIPILKYVVSAGLAGGLLGCIVLPGLIGNAVNLISKVMMGLCHIILFIYEYLSDHSIRLPYALLTVGHGSFIRIVLFYAFVYAAAGYISYRAKRYERIPEERIRGRVYHRFFSEKIRSQMGCVLSAALISLALTDLSLKNRMTIDMLSVGQGDGIVITSEEKAVFMIDGGSSSNSKLDEYVLLPYLKYHDIDHIDYWLISHPDEDHYNGVYALLEAGFDIDNIVLAKGAYRNEAYESIVGKARAAGARIIYIKPGDVLGTNSMSLTCLYPYTDEKYDDTNESSMVLWLSYGDFDALFTGDIGAESEETMLDNGQISKLADERKLEVLKTAHHGSKYSNGSRWLEELSPKFAMISAKKNNKYGHPSPETLDRFKEYDIAYLCTADCGQISVFPNKNGSLSVKKYFDRYTKK